MANNSVGSVSMDLTLNGGKSFDNEIKKHASSAENAFSGSMKKIAGFVGGAFAIGKIISFGKEAVKTATSIQSAFTGLKSIADGTGKSFANAQNFITEYTKDGLVSVTEAATAYKNLLSRGYNTNQIEKTMTALKDSAAFGRQASYDLGEAVVSATEGLKNENSILVDNAGVTKNVAKMWEEWARAHNTTTNAMTQAQKIEAEYNGIMKETKFQTGDAATYTKTFGGQVQQLKMNFTNLKVAIGSVITPLAQLFIPVINSALSAVTSFINGISSILKAFGISFPTVVGKTNNGLSSVGKTADNVSNDIAGTGKSAKKAAKEINKAFASVDEIQVLNNNNSSGDGSNSGATGGGTTANEISLINSEVNESTNAFSGLKSKIEEIFGIFKKGFDIGFSGSSFTKIIDSIKNIKNNIKDIFNSKEVSKSAKNWGNTVILNLGKITGSVGKIGTNIVTFFVSSIDLAISQNKSRIEKYFSSLFDISTESWDIVGRISEMLGSLSEIFSSDIATQIGSDIITIFMNPFMSVTELIGNFTNDFINMLVTPITDNIELLKTTFSNFLKPVKTVTDTLATAFTYVGDTITSVYDEHCKPFFDSIKNGLSDTFEKFLNVYNEYIQPFVENTANRIKELWNNNLKPLWDNIADLFSSVIDFLKILWESKLKPFIDWIIQNIIPKIMPILDKIGSAAKDIFATVSDVLSGITKALKGLITFLSGVFTGDWKKALTGVKEIFGSIFDSLKSLFKLPINWIIDGINKFISGLNKIEIPDWVPAVGGKGINIKPIPRLATGGYVEKNNPQLAIIGDNTREGEIVTPESKIYEQVLKAINTSGGGKQQIELVINVKYEDGRTIIKKINQAEIEAGETLLLV